MRLPQLADTFERSSGRTLRFSRPFPYSRTAKKHFGIRQCQRNDEQRYGVPPARHAAAREGRGGRPVWHRMAPAKARRVLSPPFFSEVVPGGFKQVMEFLVPARPQGCGSLYWEMAKRCPVRGCTACLSSSLRPVTCAP